MDLNRAYALLNVKAVDADRRMFSGIATTPTPDRVGDIVEPRGVRFQNPLPLLLFHDQKRPVGSASFLPATDKGIPFEASIPEILEPGPLKDRVDEAWQSVKYGLIKGVSIGFRVNSPDHIERLRGGAVRFKAMEVFELSLVPVPANHEAVIQTVKSLDAPVLAATGIQAEARPSLPGVSGPVKLAPKDARPTMKTIAEQIKDFEATRETKRDRMTELMKSASDAGQTLADPEAEEYDRLEGEIGSINKHIGRLQSLDDVNRASAVPVRGATPAEADASRNANGRSVISVKSITPVGIEFARLAIVKALAARNQMSPIEVARNVYPDNPRIEMYLKANVTAQNSTTDAALTEAGLLGSEFVDWLRPQTLIGRLGANGIPGPRRIPFNVPVPAATSGGQGYWVGEGKAKPLTRFNFANSTLPIAKVAGITVITEEMMRLSNPSIEALVRDMLRDALVERLDTDLVDPAKAAVNGVSPASLTNGVTPLPSAGPTADNVKTDITSLLSTFIVNNRNVAGLVIFMPQTLALALSIQTNSLGQPEFPGMTIEGGRVLGIPVLASQYLADSSGGAGNIVIAANMREIFMADDGQVQIDLSREASLQMLDNPTNDSVTPTATTMVSMFQTNSVALRAERFINWMKVSSEAVAYMDDVSWGSAGSPA